MDLIKPFRAVRYQLAESGDLGDLVAPPYDVIGGDLQKALFKRSPHNVIRLILPEARSDDGEGENKYTRAARLFQDWLKRGVLARDSEPAIYRYQISFSLKTPEGIVTRERPGFVALCKLHEYPERKILPHERTLAGPKQDRFQLMLHCRAHFSQVFLLYPDQEGALEKALGQAPPAGTWSLSCEDDDGVTHTVWPVTAPEAIAAVNHHLHDRRLYIADGHHRYETALALRRELLSRSPLFAEGVDYALAYFTPLEHPGLTIFPYHRLVHNLPKRRLSGLLKKLGRHFIVDRTLLSPLESGPPRREFMMGLAERGRAGTVFGMVDAGTRCAYYLTLKPDSPLKHECRTEAELAQAELDVVALEELVLTGTLGIKRKDLLNEKFIAYETDYDRVLTAVQKPPCQLAFLMNPTSVHEVIKVADLAGIMPEKSTYFFPKLASGLLFNLMEE